jgi:hypothetical protein
MEKPSSNMSAQVSVSQLHLRRRTFAEVDFDAFRADFYGMEQSSMSFQQQLYQQAQADWQTNQQQRRHSHSNVRDDLSRIAQLHLHTGFAPQQAATSSDAVDPLLRLELTNQSFLNQPLSYDETDFISQEQVSRQQQETLLLQQKQEEQEVLREQEQQQHLSNVPLTAEEFNQLLTYNAFFMTPSSTSQPKGDQDSWMSSGPTRPQTSSSSSSSSVLLDTPPSILSTPLFSPTDAVPSERQSSAFTTPSPLHILPGVKFALSSSSSTSSLMSPKEDTQSSNANDSFRNRSEDSREGVPACDFCRRRKVKVSTTTKGKKYREREADFLFASV